MRFILTTALLLSTALLSACGTGGPTTSDKDVEHLDYRQLEDALASSSAKSPVVLVDLRSAEAVAKGAIPGAIHIPLADLSANDERLAKAGRVIVYHEDYRGSYADIAAKKLLASGLPKVFSYAGGYQDWKSRQAGGTPEEKK